MCVTQNFQNPALSVIPIIITVTLIATVPSLMDTGHLFPCWVLMETGTERPAQTPMLLLGDIIFTLRFGNALGMCWLWFLSHCSKWKVPKAKSLPIKSLECYDAMQISPNLRRKKSWVKKIKGIMLIMWVSMISLIFPPSPASKQTSPDRLNLHLSWTAAFTKM